MSTVTSNKLKPLDEDAPQECDRTPVIPTYIISDLILPFVQDRRTWNSVCSATKELYEAGMAMTPPWPETKVDVGQMVRSLKFSPCGSFLACGSLTVPPRVSICDRRGKISRLLGHTSRISHLSFSKGGKYLASAGCDMSIRIWPTDSTGLPRQSDKPLFGHRQYIKCLDFAPDDSNVLVAAGFNEIKVWNVEREVCTHNVYHSGGSIRSMFFPAVDMDRTCIFVTLYGSLVRTCWDDPAGTISIEIVNMPGLHPMMLKSVFSPCGSLLATSSEGRNDGMMNVTLYDMNAMFVLQRVTIDACTPGQNDVLIFSPNGKTLAFNSGLDEILFLQVDDLDIRRRLEENANAPIRGDSAIAFDPSSQFVASAGLDTYVRLWTL
jgi:WD40 repeat protein